MPDADTAACHRFHTAGPFVLGALTRRDREDFVAHLESCKTCDTEVDELLSVVRLLDTLLPR